MDPSYARTRELLKRSEDLVKRSEEVVERIKVAHETLRAVMLLNEIKTRAISEGENAQLRKIRVNSN